MKLHFAVLAAATIGFGALHATDVVCDNQTKNESVESVSAPCDAPCVAEAAPVKCADEAPATQE